VQIADADRVVSGTEQFSFVAKANKVYVLTVHSFVTNSRGEFTASVRIASGSVAAKATTVSLKTKAVR